MMKYITNIVTFFLHKDKCCFISHKRIAYLFQNSIIIIKEEYYLDKKLNNYKYGCFLISLSNGTMCSFLKNSCVICFINTDTYENEFTLKVESQGTIEENIIGTVVYKNLHLMRFINLKKYQVELTIIFETVYYFLPLNLEGFLVIKKEYNSRIIFEINEKTLNFHETNYVELN